MKHGEKKNSKYIYLIQQTNNYLHSRCLLEFSSKAIAIRKVFAWKGSVVVESTWNLFVLVSEKRALKEHIDQKLKMIVIHNNSARNSAESLLPSDVCQVPATPAIIACTHPISWSFVRKHLSQWVKEKNEEKCLFLVFEMDWENEYKNISAVEEGGKKQV